VKVWVEESGEDERERPFDINRSLQKGQFVKKAKTHPIAGVAETRQRQAPKSKESRPPALS
jgi:hypothetical protein